MNSGQITDVGNALRRGVGSSGGKEEDDLVKPGQSLILHFHCPFCTLEESTQAK